MASHSHSPFLLSLTTLLLLFFFTTPTVHSATCTSPTLTSSKLYKNCNPLPSLSSTLHWTYTPTNKTLSVAFTASPPSISGWVAWGINPTSTGMAGTQAILAYKDSNGSMAVKTFNISSYSDIIEGKLSFPVYEKRAEFNSADGSITIFASVASDGGKINQVWQVGLGVSKGVPEKHEFKPANLNSKETLDLNSGGSSGGAADTSGGSVSRKRDVGFLLLGLLFALFSFLGWW